ncbi:MAG TPA: ATP-binding protein [Solirubrobacteraceae bacterium]|nr:ATP-binding protein [Solirubrobacteraceae bacterium]
MTTRPVLREERPGPGIVALAVIGSVALATAIVVPLRNVAPAVSLGGVYLLAVLAVSTWGGLWPGLATALLGAAAFNWFLIEPTGRFTVADGRDWYALAVFVVVATVASSVAEHARSRLRVAELRRQEAALTAAAATALLGEGPLRSRLAQTAQRVADAAGADSAEILPGERAAPEGEVAIPLDAARGRVGTLLVPEGLEPGVQRRLRQRVAPSLAALLAAALERDRLAAELVETEALRRSDTLKTALLRAVSHDLRSPLTAILAAGDTLGSPTLAQDDRAELSALVVTEAARLDAVIDKLLDLSRLEAGSAEPREDWCEIGELLQAATEDVERRDPGGGTFTFALHGELPLLRADPAQIERVFVNLLENARRYSAGLPVSVRAKVVGKGLVVRIVDQGPGIPSADQRRVFEPFFRVIADERAHTGHSGSGLGLAIAKGFVEANGGRIWVESVPGQGSSFVVELPVPQESPVTTAPPA